MITESVIGTAGSGAGCALGRAPDVFTDFSTEKGRAAIIAKRYHDLPRAAAQNIPRLSVPARRASG
ncbi:MAG TPA: hypothetical protein VGT03_06290 [Candidatus Acidoferrales bacterium]|nr:hypothetical protein [Candidatus Acidoferrales bacterium]